MVAVVASSKLASSNPAPTLSLIVSSQIEFPAHPASSDVLFTHENGSPKAIVDIYPETSSEDEALIIPSDSP